MDHSLSFSAGKEQNFNSGGNKFIITKKGVKSPCESLSYNLNLNLPKPWVSPILTYNQAMAPTSTVSARRTFSNFSISRSTRFPFARDFSQRAFPPCLTLVMKSPAAPFDRLLPVRCSPGRSYLYPFALNLLTNLICSTVAAPLRHIAAREMRLWGK